MGTNYNNSRHSHKQRIFLRAPGVRKINNNNPHEQELINRLEVPEQKAIRKLTILLFSMENFFKRTAEDIKRKRDVFQIWEERNRMDWNEWYHTQADLLEDEINGYSFEYAHNSKHGWCL
mgnify:CR=1 FL=1